jgi:hypothetical protein
MPKFESVIVVFSSPGGSRDENKAYALSLSTTPRLKGGETDRKEALERKGFSGKQAAQLLSRWYKFFCFRFIFWRVDYLTLLAIPSKFTYLLLQV